MTHIRIKIVVFVLGRHGIWTPDIEGDSDTVSMLFYIQLTSNYSVLVHSTETSISLFTKLHGTEGRNKPAHSSAQFFLSFQLVTKAPITFSQIT